MNADHQTGDWRQALADTVSDPASLDLGARKLREWQKVTKRFPMRVPAHILSLIDWNNPRCPIRRQALPDKRELALGGFADPLTEENFQLAPGVIRRFQDRVLALVSSRCPLNCRHCNRKRWWLRTGPIAKAEEIAQAVSQRHQVHEVILSGGEPLLRSDRSLARLLEASRSSAQVSLLRIHTRAPFSLPTRITRGLLQTLRRFRPLWLIAQFNHARELSPASRAALLRLREAGIPVLNQAVLLRGINDSVSALAALGRALVACGAKPHYLFQLDPAQGTLHFQVATTRALQLVGKLQRQHSGLLVPHLMVDLPGRVGKVALAPNTIVRTTSKGVVLRSSDGQEYPYQDQWP